MSATIRNKPLQTRSQVRLNAIKTAAIKLYNNPQIGRDRLTTAQVALLAGCSIGTFYRYFEDRYALLEAIAPDRDQTRVGGQAAAINIIIDENNPPYATFVEVEFDDESSSDIGQRIERADGLTAIRILASDIVAVAPAVTA